MDYEKISDCCWENIDQGKCSCCGKSCQAIAVDDNIILITNEDNVSSGWRNHHQEDQQEIEYLFSIRADGGGDSQVPTG